jgi:hypothetical protein
MTGCNLMLTNALQELPARAFAFLVGEVAMGHASKPEPCVQGEEVTTQHG